VKIEPKAPAKTMRPYAMIFPGWKSCRVMTSDRGELFAEGPKRCGELLRSLEGHVCYVPGGLGALRQTTGARVWEGSVWRGKITSMMLDGSKTKVSSLRGIFGDLSDPFSALSVGLEWLSDLGISPGSLSSMAWSLWRSTLSKPLSIAFAPEIGRAALYGGRQEIREARTFSEMKSIDITAAYPHAMTIGSYASTLREVAKTTTIDPTAPGIARCRVNVDPNMRNAPLPVRIGSDLIQWQRGVIEGTWTWAELDAAREVGAEIEILRTWAPVREVEPFHDWFRTVLEGRDLPAGGSTLIKAISSSLWGIFGMVGDERGRIRWADDYGKDQIHVAAGFSRKLPHAQTAHFAAETASRVRRRMLLEGMSGKYSPVHVDTDGIIIRKSAPMPENSGDAPGQWREKVAMKKVEIRAPQVYRYECRNCRVYHDPYHYITAGVPQSEAAELFDNAPKTKIAIYGLDMVLPPGHSFDTDEIDELRRTAGALQSATYGRPMIGVR